VFGVDHRVGHFWPLSITREHFPMVFSLLAGLSQDSNILHTFATLCLPSPDGEGRHRVECVLVHAWSCDAQCGKEERLATATTAAAICGPST